MGKEQSVRIQTSLLNPYEKVILQWIARRLPGFITSDHLTFLGLIGAIVIAVGYFLTVFSVQWFWLASFGFFLNWLGDSLDGTLARVRSTQRPLYGFYIDHNLDCVCEFFIILGAGLTAYAHVWSALLLIIPYLMLEVYVMINAHLKNEFKLTYSKLGPTELRLIIVIFNTILIFCDNIREFTYQIDFVSRYTYDKQPLVLGSVDVFCLSVAVILMVMYLTSLVKDAKYFAVLDPLKKKA